MISYIELKIKDCHNWGGIRSNKTLVISIHEIFVDILYITEQTNRNFGNIIQEMALRIGYSNKISNESEQKKQDCSLGNLKCFL